jgi:hypothetical protein
MNVYSDSTILLSGVISRYNTLFLEYNDVRVNTLLNVRCDDRNGITTEARRVTFYAELGNRHTY